MSADIDTDDEIEDGAELTGNQIPRQGRCTGAESDRRVGELIVMMREGRGTFREMTDHAMSSWGISLRMAQEYIAKARKELREDMEADIGDARAELCGWLREQYRKATKEGDRKSAIAAAREIGKLLGLYPATNGKPADGRDPIEALRDLLSVAAGQSQRPAEGGSDAPAE